MFYAHNTVATLSMNDVHHVLRPRLDPGWDRRIAVDLVSEMEQHLGKVKTLPELRSLLSINGYRGLRNRIENATRKATGIVALRAMAHAMRGYALANPGLAAASFRSLDVNSPEWEAAGKDLAETVLGVFASCAIHGEQALSGALILRSMVRGFVVNEMSTPGRSLDFQKSFSVAVEMIISGLRELSLDGARDTVALG